MVSKNERYRLERMFDKMREHNERQTRSITRLVLANTEAVAALAEIADMDEYAGIKDARERAQRALDSIAVKASAAVDGDQEESEQSPTEDGDTEEESTDGSN